MRLADGENVVLEAFLPSIDGLEIIAQHYHKKYNIDIRVYALSLEDFISSENEKILQELEEDLSMLLVLLIR